MIRVLLCDDHTVVRAGLQGLVETFDDVTVVGSANDVPAAVALTRERSPDVVLMDLVMPGIDGVEGTKLVLAASPTTRVVILTSFSDRHRIRAALAAGAIGYQLKDATPDELERAIRAAARGEAPIAPKAALALVSAGDEPVLSPREMETLALVAGGLANKQIARSLGITEKTVKAHLTSIFRTIDASNRTQAARWYERHTPGSGDS